MKGDIFSKPTKKQPTKLAKETPQPISQLSKTNPSQVADKQASRGVRNFFIIILVIIILIFSLPIIWYFYAVNVPVGNSTDNIAFEIIDGQTTFDVAESLKEQGLIRDKYSFALYIYLSKNNLLPGIYYLNENMNIKQLVEPLNDGTVQENKITIIEGWRREEIAEMLEKNGIVNAEEFLQASEGKEGYLFPDTYRLAVGVDANKIVNMLQENFSKRTSGLNFDNSDIILASIVEREAKNDSERAKIAGVYQNRLDAGMKLDADPTVQYAKGDWEPLTVSDYTNVKSLYNTYLYKGLPPTPISNPGLASIEAAINPEEHSYYYFLHLNDGTTLYAETLEEHNKNKLRLRSS